MRRLYDPSLGRIGTAGRTSTAVPTRCATARQSFRRVVVWWTRGMALAPSADPSPRASPRPTLGALMIRTIAAALAAFALVSFGALAEEKPAADAKATEKKATKKAKKAEKKAEKKADKAEAPAAALAK